MATKRSHIAIGLTAVIAVIGIVAYKIGSQNGNDQGVLTGVNTAKDAIKLALQQGIDSHMTLGEFYQSAFPDSTPDETTHL